MSKLLMPLPSYGFDPTEVAIPWKIFGAEGIDVAFTTPDGAKAVTDSSMLSGDRLGIWKPILRARRDAVDAHSELEADDSFCRPLKYVEASADSFDALFLPGGHDKRVREYLESDKLQSLVADFFAAEKPVAAICHGVVLAARSINPETGKSVIHDYKTTALLKSQELAAYNMTRLWLKDYYLTYPELTVEDEVRAVLSDSSNFECGPAPVLRDCHDHLERGFVVSDRNYLSARWPGDVYSISIKMAALCAER
jgi:putative intracellular protease/amidase